jgi:hypothetical protein
VIIYVGLLSIDHGVEIGVLTVREPEGMFSLRETSKMKGSQGIKAEKVRIEYEKNTEEGHKAEG